MAGLQNPRQAVVKGNFLHVRFPKWDKGLLTKVRMIPNRVFNGKSLFWSLKLSIEAINFVISEGFDIPDDSILILAQKLDFLIKEESLKAERFATSKALTAAPIQEIARKMKLPAWDYQWAPVHYALMTDGAFILGDEMALGKSVESLMVVNHSKWSNKPVGIITKAPETYQKEIHKFFGQPSLILNEPLSQLYPNIRYYISSYDRMKNFFVDTDLFLPRDYCKDMFWIFDEAHLMKNPKTLRHQFGKEILKMTDQKLLMTGTPLPNRPEEIYSLLKLMFPTFMSKTQFMMQFMGVKYTENGMVSTGLTNYQQLNRWLYENVFIRRLKSQVQTQLPDKLRESYFIKDNPVYVQADSMLELFSKSAQMKSQDKDFLSWLEIVFEETQKVGVFAHHKCMIEAIEKICIKKGYGYVKIDGSTDPTTRQALADQFADNADKKIAILSMSVAGTGINGLQAADFCVFAEFNWVPGNMLQCEDRFHRPGLKNSLTILYSIYSQLEMELSQMLLEKLGVIQRVIGHEEIPDMVKKESLMQALSVKFGLPLGGIK